MSQQYQKTANLLWYEIYDIVKQNCTEVFEDNPNDMMWYKKKLTPHSQGFEI